LLPEDKKKTERAPGDIILISYLIYVLVILVLVLFALPVIEAIAVDAQVEFVALLLAVLAVGSAITLLVYPRKKEWEIGEGLTAREEENVQLSGPVKARAETLRNALEGKTYSKILALQELRELLIRRLMLRRHLTRGEVESLMQDARWLKWTLRDDDLRELIAADLRGAVPQADLDPTARALIEEFDLRFKELVRKVEGFQ
jgi:hypothetical protein